MAVLRAGDLCAPRHLRLAGTIPSAPAFDDLQVPRGDRGRHVTAPEPGTL